MKAKSNKEIFDFNDSETVIPESSVTPESIASATPELNVDSVTLDQVGAILATEDTPKTKGKRGRKPKEAKDDKEGESVLIASMSFSLIGITKAVASLTGAKWSLDDQKEADYLAQSTIEFLDYVYPNWKKASPIVNFSMAWSSYFIKRLFEPVKPLQA